LNSLQKSELRKLNVSLIKLSNNIYVSCVPASFPKDKQQRMKMIIDNWEKIKAEKAASKIQSTYRMFKTKKTYTEYKRNEALLKEAQRNFDQSKKKLFG
jgi:hypothetical protein